MGEDLSGRRPKVAWLWPSEGRGADAPFWPFLKAYLTDLGDDLGFESLLHVYNSPAGSVRHPATRIIADSHSLNAAFEMADRADLLIYGCSVAPILEARALVTTPVTGLTEAAAVLAGSLSPNAAMVTVSAGLVPILQTDIARYTDPTIYSSLPVWSLDQPMIAADAVAAIDDPTALVRRFDDIARRAADAGASGIMVGCGGLSPVFASAGYLAVSLRPDVPVYDPCLIALAFGQQLLTLATRGFHPSRRAFAAGTVSAETWAAARRGDV